MPDKVKTAPKRMFVIDAMALAFRSFHAFGARPLTTSAGIPTSAVYGTAVFLLKLIEDEKPDYLVIATDSKEPTFRHKMYPLYKANRTEMPEDLARQLPYLFRLFDALNCKLLKQPGVEADDLIGSLVKQHSTPDLVSYIVSGDKDFMQLINHHIFLYSPKKAEPAQIIGIEGVHEKFSCGPEHVVDALALIGDTADNVPGVNGIGDKGAAKLIGAFGSLEGIYAHLDEIKNERQRESLRTSKDAAFLSRELLRIKTDLDLEHALDAMKFDHDTAIANERLLHLFEELEFRTLAQRVQAEMREQRKSSGALTTANRPLAQAPASPVVAPVATPSLDRSGYVLANTPATLKAAIDDLKAAKVATFDTETNGLDVVDSRPIGVSASTAPGKGWYIPLLDKHLEGGLTPRDVLAAIKPWIESPGQTKVAHNLKFDLQMLRNAGLRPAGPFVDTMLCSWLLDSSGREHGLDACAMRELGILKIPTSDLIGLRGETPMSEVPLEKISEYAVEDAEVTFRLYGHFMPEIQKRGLGKVLHEIEMPLVPILASMEQTGIHVDAGELAKISDHLAEESARLEEVIYKLAGEEFNINSTKQLQHILFEKLKVHEELGVKRLKKTKSGYSTDMSVLEALSEHPLPEAILAYRSVSKLKNTYVDTLPQLINQHTNRIHTSFHQTGTATGRLSSSDPNLQNIPIRTKQGREIRKAFKPGIPEAVLISADYSQIELRILAHIAGETALADSFRKGIDIHNATASRIFGVKTDEVDQTLRSRAKAINFGIIYGMGPQRLARETGVSMAEAKEFIEKYFTGYPRIKDYIADAIAKAKANGYTETMTGRRRPLPELHSTDRLTLVNAENIAVNSPIQGSAADLIKLAMIKVDHDLSAAGLKTKLLLQVHDELVFEAPNAEIARASEVIRHAMEHAMELNVPLKVEIGSGANWLEAH
ncbi:DNA polymerase I [bacterium]|nr:DNA polymerase I [bacterium]